jgi:pimeloyl-ACP methyl ester carboxylesterase
MAAPYPVVLVHGMWCTGADWGRVVELLGPRGYDCHAPTLPGHEPTADQPLRVGRLGLRDYGAFLEQYVRERAFDRPPVLVGHSMGALLAMQLAAKLPPLALVLLTPGAPRGINPIALSNIPVFARWFASGRFWRNAHKPGFERASRSAYNGIPRERHAALYERMVHESGRAAAEIALSWLDFRAAARVDAGAIRCPVYVVGCGVDRLTPVGTVRKVAALFPHCSQRYYAGRGHWVIDDDQTEEMVHAISGWIRPFEQRAARGQQPPA